MAKVELELLAFPIPDGAKVYPPGRSGDNMRVPLQSLTAEDLSDLCDDWRTRVFEAAQKTEPTRVTAIRPQFRNDELLEIQRALSWANDMLGVKPFEHGDSVDVEMHESLMKWLAEIAKR